MKLSAIKDGMVIEVSDTVFGKYYIKIGSRFLNDSGFLNVRDFNEDLTINDEEGEEFDIIGVYEVNDAYNLSTALDIKRLKPLWQKTKIITKSEAEAMIKDKLGMAVEIL